MANIRYNLIEVENGVPVKAWTKGVKLEDDTKKQLTNFAQRFRKVEKLSNN